MAKIKNSIFLLVALTCLWTSPVFGEEIIDRIVAIVNNEIVTLSELNKATQRYKDNILASQNTDARKKELIKQLESDMLGQLVETSLTIQEAGKYGIQVSEEDIDQAIENFKKTNKLNQEQLEQGLAAEGLTLEEYRSRMSDQILQSMLVNRAVRSKIVITDDEIETYYEAHKEDYSGVKKYQLRNIITHVEDDIIKVDDQLKKNADFAELAKEYSIGSNAAQGGELGLFDITSFNEEIRSALKDVEKGQYTKIFKMGGTFQIIYVEDIVMEGSLTVEQATEKIQNILFKQRGEELFKEWMTSLKKNAHIELML
ncbi:MAG: SurA N-terminal domain-containing protein [Desulfobacterales bacterium]|nr:SurA N-terminal domain-containing protein [Desulfobacterales bacterium]